MRRRAAAVCRILERHRRRQPNHDEGPRTVIAIDKPNLLLVIGIPIGLMLVCLGLTAGIFVAIGRRTS